MTAFHEIRRRDGSLAAIHKRIARDGGKDMPWLQPDGSKGLNGTKVEELPLYGIHRLDEWPATATIVVTEGEKACEALWDAGIPAVGTVTGAGSTPDVSVLSDLEGRPVILWPDADDAGRKHMHAVAGLLEPVAAVGWLEPAAGRPKGWDAADAVAAGEDVAAILATATVVPPAERTGSMLLSDVSTEAAPPRRFGRWVEQAENVIFGAGGSGKGLILANDIGRLIAEGERVYLVDYENHPDEWSRRVASLAGEESRQAVLHVAPLDPRRWQGATGPLWEVAPRLRAEADDFGATWVVVDSLGVACYGADFARDPNVPTRYKEALAIIGRPSISIAQVNRAGDLRYPFGSVLWHYQVRGSWSIETPPGGIRGTNLLLTDRKGNNHAQTERVQADVSWLDDLPQEVAEQPYLAALSDRIAAVLADSSLTAAAITSELNQEAEADGDKVAQATVRKSLGRGLVKRPRQPQRFAVTGTGKDALWHLHKEAE